MATTLLPELEFFTSISGRHSICRFLTSLVCGVVLLGHNTASQAESVSGRLSVSVRVVRACHFHTNPKTIVRNDSLVSPHAVRTATRTTLTINCGTESEDASMMPITTESKKADMRIIDILSNEASVQQAHVPDKVIYKTTDPDRKIIRWGLFRIDAQLSFSTLDNERPGESVITDGHERFVKLIIDF